VVREAVDFVEHDVHENHVNIDLQLSTVLRPVMADMMQIQQVVLNLVRNGIEAMQETEPAERRLTLQTSGAGSEAITVAVADNGCGCSDEVVERVFDAFFTTKPNGIGMGLAVSRSIIEAHGGRLWPTPNPDGGMTFRFTLPVAPGGPMS
jgi:signal transduction histidine kinase